MVMVLVIRKLTVMVLILALVNLQCHVVGMGLGVVARLVGRCGRVRGVCVVCVVCVWFGGWRFVALLAS